MHALYSTQRKGRKQKPLQPKVISFFSSLQGHVLRICEGSLYGGLQHVSSVSDHSYGHSVPVQVSFKAVSSHNIDLCIISCFLLRTSFCAGHLRKIQWKIIQPACKGGISRKLSRTCHICQEL